MSRKAHRVLEPDHPREVQRSLVEIVRDASAMFGPYSVLYRDVYDSAKSASAEMRVTGSTGGKSEDPDKRGLPHSDPIVDHLDSRDHQHLHAAALSISEDIREMRKIAERARVNMDRAVGRWKQPERDRKGWVGSDDLELAVQRRKERMEAGGEMERVQRGDS